MTPQFCKSLFQRAQKSNFSAMGKSFLYFLVVLMHIGLTAQEEKLDYNEVKDIENFGKFRYVQVIGHFGSHFYSGQDLDDALTSGYGALEVRLGWQNNDPEDWSNKYYNAMTYGVGFYSGYIGDPAVLGNPNALYGFLDMPFGNYYGDKRTTWHFSPAFGLTYNLVPYDETNNPTNDAIGAKFAVYINFAFSGHTAMTRDMDFYYGLDYTHFSNGRSFTPNYGLNMIGLHTGLKYHYNKAQKEVNRDLFTNEVIQSRFKRIQSTPIEKAGKNKIHILTAFGSVQNGHTENEQGGGYEDNRYNTFSGSIEYTREFDMKHGVSVGFDLFYDESLIINYPDPNDRYLYAYHFGYDYTFWKITVKTQLGGYFGENGDKGKEKVWARPAIQYNAWDWMSFHVGLKTRRGFAADWAEFGVVFHPFAW